MKPKVEYLVQYFEDGEWHHWSKESSLLNCRASVKEFRNRRYTHPTRILKRTITETVVEETKP